jgi:hypothetical protein
VSEKRQSQPRQVSSWFYSVSCCGISKLYKEIKMATSKAMKEWEKKYAAQIKGLAEANKVDLGVASSMLQKNLTGGGQYKGGGTISSVQAASELAAAQKAGRAAASPSAKRSAASLGATIPTATAPTADSYYSDQLTSLADAQRKAEEQAAKLRTQQAISSVESYIPQIQQQTAKQMQEAYIAAQRAKMAAPQTLAAMGYTGGAAESSLMGLDTDYMNRRQALSEAESVSMDQIRQNIADIQATGNVELANLAANYYSNLMQAQREAQAQQMAQQRWEAEMAVRQAEQDENTRRWNLQNVGVGLGAGATTPTANTDWTQDPYYKDQPDSGTINMNNIKLTTDQVAKFMLSSNSAMAAETIIKKFQNGTLTKAEANYILEQFGLPTIS